MVILQQIKNTVQNMIVNLVSIDRIKSTFGIVLVVALAVVINVGQLIDSVKAQDTFALITKQSQGVDLSLIAPAEGFSEPRSVTVMPIFLPQGTNLSAREWYQGLVYYFSSDRYNFRDVPAHYVLDSRGNLYEGINGGMERDILVEGVAQKGIIILYLAEFGDTQISINATPRLTSLVQTLVNENSIQPTEETVQIKSLKVEKIASDRVVNLVAEQIFGSWQPQFNSIREAITSNYTPEQKSYSLEVIEVKLPTEEVVVGTQVVAALTVKNTSRYNIFADSNSEIILSKNGGGDSQYFINNVWLSKAQAALLSEDEVLRPGEEKTLEFRLSVPLTTGNYSESFRIENLAGQRLSAQDYELTLRVNKGSFNILEVISTETGTLNVRQNPNAGSGLVTRISIGQRFIWTESQGGWYKITVDGQEGWVSGRYVKLI